jgi:hypothetical protein
VAANPLRSADMKPKAKPVVVVIATRPFESSKKDVEKKSMGKEGGKREEKFDTKQSRKK